MDLRIEEERAGPVTVLRLDGEFDARALPEAGAVLDRIYRERRYRLVVDVGGLELANSTAAGFLAGAAQRARAYDGRVVLCRASRHMRETLRILRFDSLFEHCDNEADAVARAGDGAS